MYPQAYIQYLVYFHGPRDYFECHEVLEEYWKGEGNKKPIWVGLIQLAVSRYHHRRGNFVGAKRMLHSAKEILENESLTNVAIDKEKLLILINTIRNDLEQGQPYQSINLPLIDPELEQRCKQICKEWGYIYGNPSNMEDSYLIHKHSLRDRSSIIEERNQRLLQKRIKANENLPHS